MQMARTKTSGSSLLAPALPAGLALLGLCAPALAGTPDSLTTMFASDNGQDGNMFNVTAATDIQIVSFDMNIDAGATTIEVYTCPGGYNGNELNAGAWTLVGSGSTNGVGADVATPLPFAVDIQVQAGQTMGIYLTTSSGTDFNYTNGSTEGAVAAQNQDLTIDEGRGVQYPFVTTYTPRIWNGTLYYFADTGTPYCSGDGQGGVCPCGNFGQAEAGCVNSSGSGAMLVGEGSASVAADSLYFRATQLPPGRFAMMVAGTADVNGGLGLPFGDGMMCTSGTSVSFGVKLSNAAGEAAFGPGLGGLGGFQPGTSRYFQVIYRDSSAMSPCGLRFNTSNGVRVDLQS
jgi:hypothetical protein